MPRFSHVVFQHICPSQEVSVPFDQAEAYFCEHDGNVRINKVHGGDPDRWIWAKAWFWEGDRTIAYIGAGAYGDMIVWQSTRHIAQMGDLTKEAV